MSFEWDKWVFQGFFCIRYPFLSKCLLQMQKCRKLNLIPNLVLWWTKVLKAVCECDWHMVRSYLFFNMQTFWKRISDLKKLASTSYQPQTFSVGLVQNFDLMSSDRFFDTFLSFSFSVTFSDYLRPNAAGAWRRLPPQSLWCGRSSVCTTSIVSVAVYVTDSWGKGTSLYWRTDSCCARMTMRRRKTSSALSAPMTQIQVWIQANLYTTDLDASVFMNIYFRGVSEYIFCSVQHRRRCFEECFNCFLFIQWMPKHWLLLYGHKTLGTFFEIYFSVFYRGKNNTHTSVENGPFIQHSADEEQFWQREATLCCLMWAR